MGDPIPTEDIAPVLTALLPAQAMAGGNDVTITLNGSGFTDTSVLVWNGADDTMDFISATEATTVVKTSLSTEAIACSVAVRNGVELSNELTFYITEDVPPTPLPKPEESESPNTPAVPAVYMAPDPPDVYQGVQQEQVTPPGTTGTGEPDPEKIEEQYATSNVPGGGLPTNPQEPYPTGNPPTRTWQQIRGGL